MRGLVLPLLLALAGCATSGALPDDVPDPEHVGIYEQDGFHYFVDQDCLSRDDRQALHEELSAARAKLRDWLGPALSPGDFRPRGTPRATCPPNWEFGPVPPPGTIEVVVLKTGGRCHADRDGIAIVQPHVARGDATHELVHYLAGSAWHPIDEGLAVYLTELIAGPDKGYPLASRARAYRDLNLATHLTPREIGDRMSRRDYDVAGAFVGWLIRSFGKSNFLQLYAGPERDYMTRYGMGERELMERFWSHVGSLDVSKDSAYYAFMAVLENKRKP